MTAVSTSAAFFFNLDLRSQTHTEVQQTGVKVVSTASPVCTFGKTKAKQQLTQNSCNLTFILPICETDYIW